MADLRRGRLRKRSHRGRISRDSRGQSGGSEEEREVEGSGVVWGRSKRRAKGRRADGQARARGLFACGLEHEGIGDDDDATLRLGELPATDCARDALLDDGVAHGR